MNEYGDYEVVLEQNRFMVRVYAWMCAALAVTGIVGYASYATGLIFTVMASLGMIGFYVILGLQLLLVVSLSGWIKKMSAQMATVLFFIYSAMTGLSVSLIFIVYTPGSILSVFFITAGLFAFMSAYGYYTQKDLTAMGSLLMMALIGLILASIVNIFLKNSMFDFILTCVGILIFIGLIAYDTQKIKKMNIIGNEGTDEDTKESIIGALTLYLDFINLFLRLLRLLGKRR